MGLIHAHTNLMFVQATDSVAEKNEEIEALKEYKRKKEAE